MAPAAGPLLSTPWLAADRLLSKPDNVSFEQAAAVPISGFAALQAVRHGGVRPGQRVLIIGAGGGVGTFAVQIAKAKGAEVTGVSSTSKTELVRSIGADHMIDYTREDFADGRDRYDVILDIAGNRPLSELRRALTSRGTLVIVGAEDAGNWLGIRRQLRAAALSPFVGQKLGFFISKERREDLEELRKLLEAGTIWPVVDRTFTLEEVPAAIRYLETAAQAGRLSSLSGQRQRPLAGTDQPRGATRLPAVRAITRCPGPLFQLP